MAIVNAVNYEKAYVNKPFELIRKGEKAGRKRLLFDSYVLASALGVGDEIFSIFIPDGSVITDAKIKIDKSLGATGIFELGTKANELDAEDSNSLVSAADAGGQAVLKRADLSNVGIHKRYESQTQVFLTCTEIMDGSVLDAVITLEVEYAND